MEAKSYKKNISNNKILSLKEFVSFHVRLIIRTIKILKNPFQYTFRNKKFAIFAKPDRMTLSHTVETRNNRLFELFNRLIFCNG